ncbi:MAG: TraR/DksA C4-type zinc finger protein [Candidatus Pacebacteria bacterium]|nr:TraR/DksA C4-type zinc finger protein [Candidatus Paceibacterota bacterium]MDD3919306.1 TraR/DksA C4-type zinc finger protein [Candidatus Paceibacterota bacterium]
MFEQDFIDNQKNKLEKEKEELEKNLSDFASKESKDNWETKYPDIAPDERDPEDSADEVEEYVDLLPQEYTLEIKLKNVNDALEKIKEGTYGICENCKRPISQERLEANPSAKKCIECIEL